MRFPIETVNQSGLSLYVVIHNPDGRVWNTTLNSGAGDWQVYNSGNWAQYAIALVEQSGSGYYKATYPAGIGAVLTTEVIYANASPTLGDAPQGVAQSQGSNIAAVDGDADAQTSLQRSLASMVRGKVIAGTLTAKAFSTDVVNANSNAFAGRALYFATGTLAGQGSTITGYNTSTGVITLSGPFTGAPAVNDTFVIS